MQGQYRQYPQQSQGHPQPHATPQKGHAPNARRMPPGAAVAAGPHHNMPPSQAQMAQQSQAHAIELARRRSRKPTDKTLPDGVDDCVTDTDIVAMYNNLRSFERRLDATMARKRLDIVENFNKHRKHSRTLRIWISNAVEDQPWQAAGLNVGTAFDFNAGLEATYRVKIEGRLLDDELDAAPEGEDADAMDEDGSKEKNPVAPKYRFSHFFRAMTVDFPNSRNPETSVEWKKPDTRAQPGANLPAAADFDELTFKRSGDDNMNITINLYRHEEPERFLLSPELAEVVDMKEATRHEVMLAVWDYVKLFGLQEDEEKRNFRCDELLKKVIKKGDVGAVPLIGEYIAPHLHPLPPVSLPYTVRVDKSFHDDLQPTIYDIQVQVENPLRMKMLQFLNDPGYGHMLKEAAMLDESLAKIVQCITMSKAKHSFFSSLGEDPVNFLRSWLSSQKRDLDVITGDGPRSGEDEARGGEWRRGGKNAIWSSQNAREGVNVMLATKQRTSAQHRQG